MQYQPYYCEENIHHLCRRPDLAGRSPAAVFIRGAGEVCVMWHQRSAPARDEPICWDYHVVLLAQRPWEIWDLDTTLPCPCPAADYLIKSFRPALALPPEVAPWFRVVDAPQLLATFASDRSHMRDPGGKFLQPPPSWPAIGPPDVASNLARFLDLRDEVAGEVLDLPALLRRVAHAPPNA